MKSYKFKIEDQEYLLSKTIISKIKKCEEPTDIKEIFDNEVLEKLKKEKLTAKRMEHITNQLSDQQTFFVGLKNDGVLKDYLNMIIKSIETRKE